MTVQWDHCWHLLDGMLSKKKLFVRVDAIGKLLFRAPWQVSYFTECFFFETLINPSPVWAYYNIHSFYVGVMMDGKQFPSDSNIEVSQRSRS